VSIRLKILGIAVLTIALYAGLDFLLQQAVIQPSFEDLEREQAQRDMARCVQALRREVQHLNQFCLDWAAKEHICEYVAAPSSAYEERNLVPATFADNNLNLLYLVNAAGKVVWGAVYDLKSREPISLPDFAAEHWGREHPLLRHATPESSIAGVLLTSRGPMLVASRPMVRRDAVRDACGAVVMGRFLEASYLTLLSEQTQVRMRLTPLEAGGTPSDTPATLIQALHGPFSVTKTDSRLEVSVIIPDVLGKPAFVLYSETPREITVEGRAAMRLDAIGAGVVGLFVLLLLLLLLRHMVIEPLSSVTAHVGRIAESGELAPAPDAERADEFGQLSRAFNRMVERLRRDSATRREAEDALRESEQRFQTLLMSLDDVVWSAPLDVGSLLYVNAAVERLFGRPVSEFVGRPDAFVRFVHPEYRETVAEKLCLLRASGRFEMEYPIVRADGETRWVHDRRIVIHDAQGRPRRIGGVISDITDLRRMHENMVRNRHLAEVGELGASVAHEIRNPLTGISGALQVIRGGLPQEDPRRAAVEEALGQVARVEQTVQQLLQYARPWTPQLRRGDVRAWLRDASVAVRGRCGLTATDIEVEPGPPLEAAFDPALLEQVLENLIQNASQAAPDGARVHIQATDAGSTVRVVVRDFGPGIPEANLQRVFEPFFTTRARGSGLGLSICRRILEAHGGAIEIRNCNDAGVEVTLYLAKEESA